MASTVESWTAEVEDLINTGFDPTREDTEHIWKTLHKKTAEMLAALRSRVDRKEVAADDLAEVVFAVGRATLLFLADGGSPDYADQALVEGLATLSDK